MIYVMSDIHGNWGPFASIMKQIKLNKEDRLYVLGDVIDRHPYGIRILQVLRKMPNVTILKGNHEYMMQEYFREPDNGHKRWIWLSRNGGIDTYNSFKYCSTRLKNDILKYIEQMPLNCEVEVDGKTYLLIHGAPTDSYDPMSSMYSNREEHAVWTRLDASFVVPKGKTLVFGHTPTIRYMPVDPEEWYTRRQMMPVWFGKSKIGIDCGCAYPNGGRLACLRLDDMRVFYSSYMDDEKGDSTE